MKITIAAVGSRGDVHPLIALGQGLTRAGHRVRLAAHPVFEAEAGSRGLAFSPVQALIRTALTGCPKPLDPLDFLLAPKASMVPFMDRMMASLGQACSHADLLLYTPLALGMAGMARALGIPAFPVCQQPLVRTRAFPSPLVSTNLPIPSALNRMSHRAAELGLAAFYQRFVRIDGKRGLNGYLKPVLDGRVPVINGFSSLLVPSPPDWKENHHITGFWFLDPPRNWEPPRDLARFLAAGPAPVCIGFGSMDDPDTGRIIDAAVSAVKGVGLRAVVLTGWSGMAGPKTDSSGVFFTREVPHAWLLPRCAAVIHHGGAGTTAAAVRAGIPSLILPFFFDQAFWADRLKELGAGPGPLPRTRTGRENLALALDRLLTHEPIRRRLQALSLGLGREKGVARAVALIQSLVGGAAV